MTYLGTTHLHAFTIHLLVGLNIAFQTQLCSDNIHVIVQMYATKHCNTQNSKTQVWDI